MCVYIWVLTDHCQNTQEHKKSIVKSRNYGYSFTALHLVPSTLISRLPPLPSRHFNVTFQMEGFKQRACWLWVWFRDKPIWTTSPLAKESQLTAVNNGIIALNWFSQRVWYASLYWGRDKEKIKKKNKQKKTTNGEVVKPVRRSDGVYMCENYCRTHGGGVGWRDTRVDRLAYWINSKPKNGLWIKHLRFKKKKCVV